MPIWYFVKTSSTIYIDWQLVEPAHIWFKCNKEKFMPDRFVKAIEPFMVAELS